MGSSGCARCLRTPLARAAQGCQASLPPGGLWPLPKPSLCSCFPPVTYRAGERPPPGCTFCRRRIPCPPAAQHGPPGPREVPFLAPGAMAKGLLLTDDKDDTWPRPQRPLDSPWRYECLLLHRMSPGKLLPLAVVGRMMAAKEICIPSPRACDCDALNGHRTLQIGLNQGCQGREKVLDYPKWPSVTAGSLRVSQGPSEVLWEGPKSATAGCEGGRGHQPRDVGGP